VLCIDVLFCCCEKRFVLSIKNGPWPPGKLFKFNRMVFQVSDLSPAREFEVLE
jgi:hypothetical protein